MAKSSNHNHTWILCLAILTAGVMVAAPARAEDGDWEHWDDLQYSQTVGYGLDLALRYQQRWEEDISRFSYYEIEPMAYWRYSPRWDFMLSYERDTRIEPESDVNDMAATGAMVKVPLKEWLFTNLFRIEWTVPESGMDWFALYKNRAGVSTTFKIGSRAFVPYLADEFSYDIQDGRFTENRLQAGIGTPIVPHWMVSIYFMRLDERMEEGWEWHPVIGLEVLAQF